MKKIILASASVLAIAASPTYAQSGPTADERPTVPQGQTGLEDIIVTAQRTSESAQKAPVAITVIKPQELIAQNVTRAEDLSRVAPALVATASGGPNTTFFIRGVGNITNNSYSDPAISFNYDGVYIGRPNATQGFFFDLQRVEVLKGPQGTLYGRNATGGAINVIPARPVIGETSAELQASYGNYNAVQAQGAINLPLGQDAAFRVAGAYSKHDGYLSDGTADQDSASVRAQLLVNLTPNLTNRIGADYSHQGGAGTGSFVYGTFGYSPAAGKYVFTPTPQFGPKIGIHDPLTEAFTQTRFISQVGRLSEALNSYPSQDNAVWGITNETNWKTRAGTLTIQAAYRQSDVNSVSTASQFRAFSIDEHVDQVTLEARFAGKIGKAVDYLAGAFLFDENIKNASAINQLTVLPIQTYTTGTNSKAVFGQLAFHATRTVTFTAAGRYTQDYKRLDGLSDVYTVFCGNPGPPQDFCPTLPLTPAVTTGAAVVAFYTARGIPVTSVPLFALPPAAGGSQTAPFVLNTKIAINSSQTTDKFTYRLAADWQVTPSNLLYASYQTGFHAGGFSFARGLDTYKPETIQAYTIGSKNRLFNNRLQFNVEAFYWKYKDQQVAQFGFDLGTPPASVFYTSNIGSSTIKGVDIDADFLLTPTTRINGSFQYLDATYDNFVTFAGNNGTPPNFDCINTLNAAGTQYRVDCSGKRALYSPEFAFNIGAEQTVHFDRFKLVARGGTRWRGDFYAITSFQPWIISRAAFQSDASLTLVPNSDRFFVTAFINNIEDKRRITQALVNNSLGIQSAIATAPRTYGLRIGVKFK